MDRNLVPPRFWALTLGTTQAYGTPCEHVLGGWRDLGSRPRALPCSGPGREGEGGEEATCRRVSSQGTTGSPKGATLSHYNIVNNANIIGERLKLHLKVRGCRRRLADTLPGSRRGRGGRALLGSPAG